MSRKFPAGRRSRTPSIDRSSALDAITRLMEERDKYEQWLDELEEKQDSTPPKVFDRVRQDYLTRLQSVMDQLGEHTVVLQEHAANLVAKLRELEASEQEISDELAEAELRAKVGEITEAEWVALSKKSQREVAKLKENQELIADDLIRIRDILAGDDVDEDEDEAPRTSADFDELEFLKSVVGHTGAHASPKVDSATPPPAPKRPATPPATQVQGTAEKSMSTTMPRKTPTGGAPRAPAPPAAPPRPAPSPAQGTPAVADQKKAPKPAAPAVPERPDNALGVSPSDVPEQPKTLKCAECGTMNYPSEWYCERCGAELAQI